MTPTKRKAPRRRRRVAPGNQARKDTRRRPPARSVASSSSDDESTVYNPSCSTSKASSLNGSVHHSKSYRKIKQGLRKSIPAAIVMWAFHRLPSSNGLTSRRVINFLKKHYRVIDNPKKTGTSISSLLRCAVEFGLIEKRGNRYFLATRKSHH